MKIEKNKIVFAGIVLTVILFIGVYAYSLLGTKDQEQVDANRVPVPELEDEQKNYESKLEALDDLKEVRESNAPSIYDERLLDSTGTYDPDLLDKEKMRIVDSIYRHARINYSDKSLRKPAKDSVMQQLKIEKEIAIEKKEENIDIKELGLKQQLFFASNPLETKKSISNTTDTSIYVEVDGTQTVKKEYRLQMQLVKDTQVSNVFIPKNTPVYGFVNFKPNRVMIDISHINHIPVKLKAFDIQDGREGIYIENSFRAEARQEVVDDLVDDINIAGVPQVKGIKKIFQRSNRNVKVTIANNYKLLLKIHK